MAQPDNFGFGEEAALLKASARKFFTDKFPTSRLHALVAADHRPERGRIAPHPFELGHVPEVHAIDSRHHGRHRDQRRV